MTPRYDDQPVVEPRLAVPCQPVQMVAQRVHRACGGEVLHGGGARRRLGVEPAQLQPLGQGDVVGIDPLAPALAGPPGHGAGHRAAAQLVEPDAVAEHGIAGQGDADVGDVVERPVLAADQVVEPGCGLASARHPVAVLAGLAEQVLDPARGAGGVEPADLAVRIGPQRGLDRGVVVAAPGEPDHQAVVEAAAGLVRALGQLGAGGPGCRQLGLGCEQLGNDLGHLGRVRAAAGPTASALGRGAGARGAAPQPLTIATSSAKASVMSASSAGASGSLRPVTVK